MSTSTPPQSDWRALIHGWIDDGWHVFIGAEGFAFRGPYATEEDAIVWTARLREKWMQEEPKAPEEGREQQVKDREFGHQRWMRETSMRNAREVFQGDALDHIKNVIHRSTDLVTYGGWYFYRHQVSFWFGPYQTEEEAKKYRDLIKKRDKPEVDCPPTTPPVQESTTEPVVTDVRLMKWAMCRTCSGSGKAVLVPNGEARDCPDCQQGLVNITPPCEIKATQCAQCGGDGKVDAGNEKTVPCPNCRATGWITGWVGYPKQAMDEERMEPSPDRTAWDTFTAAVDQMRRFKDPTDAGLATIQATFDAYRATLSARRLGITDPVVADQQRFDKLMGKITTMRTSLDERRLGMAKAPLNERLAYVLERVEMLRVYVRLLPAGAAPQASILSNPAREAGVIREMRRNLMLLVTDVIHLVPQELMDRALLPLAIVQVEGGYAVYEKEEKNSFGLRFLGKRIAGPFPDRDAAMSEAEHILKVRDPGGDQHPLVLDRDAFLAETCEDAKAARKRNGSDEEPFEVRTQLLAAAVREVEVHGKDEASNKAVLAHQQRMARLAGIDPVHAVLLLPGLRNSDNGLEQAWMDERTGAITWRKIPYHTTKDRRKAMMATSVAEQVRFFSHDNAPDMPEGKGKAGWYFTDEANTYQGPFDNLKAATDAGCEHMIGLDPDEDGMFVM